MKTKSLAKTHSPHDHDMSSIQKKEQSSPFFNQHTGFLSQDTPTIQRTPFFNAMPITQTGKATIQRKISWDGFMFEGDGDRPGWRTYLKKSTAALLSVPPNTDFGKIGFDRTHKIPFAAIEALVVDFCNGDVTEQEFDDLTDSLFDSTSVNMSHRKELTEMKKKRTFLKIKMSKKPPDHDAIAKEANALLSVLNSSTFNVSAGDASENRGVSDRPDYRYKRQPDDSVTLTPGSQQLHDAWQVDYDRGLEVPLSPGGTSVRSSQYGTEQETKKVKEKDVVW